MKNVNKQMPTKGLKQGSVAKKQLKRTKTIAAVFPRGSTSTITARRKGDPQHYVKGKNECNVWKQLEKEKMEPVNK